MNHSEINSQQLGEVARRARVAAGLGVRALARQIGVDATWISRLEHGEYGKPDPRMLAKLADGLDIEVTDLYLAAGYQPGHGLPGLAPYLRAKYDLPPEAIRQLEDHFELINDRYVRKQKGGHHGQDHQRAA